MSASNGVSMILTILSVKFQPESSDELFLRTVQRRTIQLPNLYLKLNYSQCQSIYRGGALYGGNEE